MGIKNFLQHYYGGQEYHVGFTKFSFASKRIVLDAAGLLFSCAMQHSASYMECVYTTSLQAFQRQLIYLNNTLRWDMVVVFDGSDSRLRHHKRRRRDLSRSVTTARPPDRI
mmetsp:Transcript_5047/g.6589  ORF Transcript_5047/g.6589 Transcript_5047/m.6589 type:complete len:111 (-) Transcript_5047:77-409(-)